MKTKESWIASFEKDPLSLVPAELLPLLPGFLDRREKDVLELKKQLIHGDFLAIKMIGHRLKGNGLGFGFSLVTEIGRELEIAAQNQECERIQETIAVLAAFNGSLKRILAHQSQ